jgi:hypothetical protein
MALLEARDASSDTPDSKRRKRAKKAAARR